MSHEELKNRLLKGAIVTKVIENEFENLLGLCFKKGKKSYELKIKGFECETSLIEIG